MLQVGCLPIGIDLGASGAKMVQLRPVRGGLALQALSRVEVPAMAGVAPGDPARIDALIDAVAKRALTGGFSGRKCVISIDDRMVRTRSVRQPHMPLSDMDSAARIDAPMRLGFNDSSECEIGWLLAGEVRHGDDSRDELIYVGAERAPLERLVYGLAAVGLRPLVIEPGFTSCARCFTRNLRRTADQSIVRLIVDVGLETTGVILTKGQSVAFYKQLEMGGAALTRAASERLGLEPSTVEDLRRKRMLPDEAGSVDSKVDRALYDAVRPLMGDLAHEVSLCLRYYSVTFRGAKPECCFVSGGEAAEPRLAECIQEALHLTATVGQPFQGMNVGGRGRSPLRGSGCEWGTATGLSLRVLDDVRARRREQARRGADQRSAMSGKSESRAAA